MKKIILIFLLLLFAIIPVHAEYCNWNIMLLSMREFDYDNIDLSQLSRISNLEQDFPIIACNTSIEKHKMELFFNRSYNKLNITITPYSDENGYYNVCSFRAKATSNITLNLDYDGIVEIYTTIEGCYNNVPRYDNEYNKLYSLGGYIPRMWNNVMFILHLEDEGYNSSQIVRDLKQSDWNNTLILNVNNDVKDILATNKFQPFAQESSSRPIVLVTTGNPTFGGYRWSAWEYPIEFFKLSAINSVINRELIFLDVSLENELNNLSIIKNDASEIFLESKETKKFENGINNLEKLREQLISSKPSTNFTKINQVEILVFLEKKELSDPDPYKDTFSINYFKPLLDSQIDITEQTIDEIKNKNDKIEVQKEQARALINEYINDLSILKEIDSTKKQINLAFWAFIIAVIALFVSTIAQWGNIKKNLGKFKKLVERS